jgi:hypothetical protein
MFGYGYKEDALKWREHKKKLDDAELAKTAKMVCKVHLKGGDVLDYTLECSSRWHDAGFLEEYWIVIPAKKLVLNRYEDLCDRANENGLHINGSFYPSCQIKRIERGQVEVTTNDDA